MHDFRKGIQVQTKAQPVKTGVAKPDGPKRRFFPSAWQPVAEGTLLPPCRAMRAVKGVFYLETEQPFCVANSHFKKNQPSVLLGKE